MLEGLDGFLASISETGWKEPVSSHDQMNDLTAEVWIQVVAREKMLRSIGDSLPEYLDAQIMMGIVAMIHQMRQVVLEYDALPPGSNILKIRRAAQKRLEESL